jgi:transposase
MEVDAPLTRTGGAMEVIYQRCCGLDIHKKTVVACRLVWRDGEPEKEIRTFGTMTRDLLERSDWLQTHEVTHVAMESTGVYWKPVWNLLEGNFEMLLVNAQHIKRVPGRKTDVKDCEWIAQLLQHGLLQGSFVPDREQRELRELTRYRTSLLRDRAREVNRLQKVLEGANIKLAAVVSDITGRSGRDILKALVEGTTDPESLAQLARGVLRKKIPQLEQALLGSFNPHQSFLIAEQLAHLDFLDESIQRVSQEIEERMLPLAEELALLDEVPGISKRAAEVLIAELGTDMGRFPTHKHVASWAGMCPGNHESGGKRQSGWVRKGNPWLRSVLIEAAQSVGRMKSNYLGEQYRRLAGRRGKKKATVAVGHSILVIVYHLLKEGSSYRELGSDYFDERHRQRVQRRLVRRLEGLGYKVTLESLTAAA